MLRRFRFLLTHNLNPDQMSHFDGVISRAAGTPTVEQWVVPQPHKDRTEAHGWHVDNLCMAEKLVPSTNATCSTTEPWRPIYNLQ